MATRTRMAHYTIILAMLWTAISTTCRQQNLFLWFQASLTFEFIMLLSSIITAHSTSLLIVTVYVLHFVEIWESSKTSIRLELLVLKNLWIKIPSKLSTYHYKITNLNQIVEHLNTSHITFVGLFLDSKSYLCCGGHIHNVPLNEMIKFHMMTNYGNGNHRWFNHWERWHSTSSDPEYCKCTKLYPLELTIPTQPEINQSQTEVGATAAQSNDDNTPESSFDFQPPKDVAMLQCWTNPFCINTIICILMCYAHMLLDVRLWVLLVCVPDLYPSVTHWSWGCFYT